ncbi:MAG: Hsp70 family protein [Desulfobacteraceae bacterium]|nr:Hsp70 family protein [Desulfobacteraceae bacterium]
MEPIVGIDLGTTNSEVAFVIDGCAEILTEQDNGIVPSCVGLDAQGNILVGRQAANQAAFAPERTVSSIKRKMGEEIRIALGSNQYLPQEISALILKTLRQRAEEYLGQPVGKAVITVPAYFTDSQRQATREAGRIAGLEVLRIINEPTAAALAYENTSGKTAQILVYDLGGGTFDVSIVKIENGVIEVMASTGDNRLGGDDFDEMIAGWLAGQIKEKHGIEVTDDPMVMHRLKQAAEKAKIRLSSAPYAVIEEDHIAAEHETPVHLTCELSREEFEKMLTPDLDRTMDAVSRAMEDAGLTAADLDEIILVGGSTRIPTISKLLEEKTGVLPRNEIDPDLCVALGAALQAGREMGVSDAGVLIDITPYTFGTSAIGELYGELSPDLFVPMIRRNTKLPASKSEVFYTVCDEQEKVEIKVYQGESPDARNNVMIGNYMFELSPAPAQSPVIMRFDLDINGILQLEAVEKETGGKIQATIENAISRFTEEELAASGERINRLWDNTGNYEKKTDSTKTAEKPEAPADLANLIGRAESILDTAPAEDRDEIINLLEDIKGALNTGATEEARNIGADLEDLLFYLE